MKGQAGLGLQALSLTHVDEYIVSWNFMDKYPI